MLVIPLNAVPSQTLGVELDGQQAQIAVYQLGTPPEVHLYFDLVNAGSPVVTCRVCRAFSTLGPNPETPPLLLVDAQYQGFAGDFVFVDTQGDADPTYDGLGTRWQLLYLEAADLLDIEVESM